MIDSAMPLNADPIRSLDFFPYTMRAHLICAAYLAVQDQRTRDQFITLARAFYDIMADASAKEREATLKLAQGEFADE